MVDLHENTAGCSIPHCLCWAELTIDGDPYCLACAVEQIDRWQAISIAPSLRETLPSLWDK